MMKLTFESKLNCSREEVWEWITSFQGISKELRPYLRMTAPKGIRKLTDIQIQPGVRLFRSYIFLFGFIPIDFSDLTLMELQQKYGFKEESPMGSMKLWRHERFVIEDSLDAKAIILVDNLSFQPRFASAVISKFVHLIFNHRHRILRQYLSRS